MSEPRGTERVLYEDDKGRTVGDVYQLDSRTLRPGTEFTTRTNGRYVFDFVHYPKRGSTGTPATRLHAHAVGNRHRTVTVAPEAVTIVHRNRLEQGELPNPPPDDNARYTAAYNRAKHDAIEALKERHAAEYSRLLADARVAHNAYRSDDTRYRQP